jgi:hypothetical protein
VGKAEEKMHYMPRASGTMERVDTYQTDPLTKYTTSRKGIQDINSSLERRHELSVVSLKVMQGLCLLFNDADDGVGRVAIYKLVNNLMLDQVGPCSLLKSVQGRFKEYFQLWKGIDRHGVGME